MTTTLFIPTLNELEAMRVVLPQIDRSWVDQILVVDGSTDGTADYARAQGCEVVIQKRKGLRWAFMGPYETIDLNAPGGVRDYVERYESLYVRLWPSQQHIVPWGEAVDRIEADRQDKLPRDELPERARWRDRRLMALVAHKQRAAKDIGK